MTKVTEFIGIDISKKSFDVCFCKNDDTSVRKSATYSFSDEDIAAFISRLPVEGLCIMEATGNYHIRLATRLHEAGYRVSVVNPLSVHRFAQMRMMRAKTDRKDAALLCDYARMNIDELPLFSPSSPELVEVRQLLALMEQLSRQNTQLINQAEALKVSAVKSGTAENIIAREQAGIKASIEEIEKKIDELIDKNNHDDYKRILSIKGVGKKSARVLIAATDSMKKFSNYRQLCSYFGLSPRIYQSGTSVNGKSHICKMGMARVRRLLYMASISASRYNNACRALFDRLIAAGKPRMVALVAVEHKLLKIAFALCKNKTYFSNDFFAPKLA